VAASVEGSYHGRMRCHGLHKLESEAKVEVSDIVPGPVEDIHVDGK
jgi:hypothetical protein